MILLAVGVEEERTGDCSTMAGAREELKSNCMVDDTNNDKGGRPRCAIEAGGRPW